MCCGRWRVPAPTSPSRRTGSPATSPSSKPSRTEPGSVDRFKVARVRVGRPLSWGVLPARSGCSGGERLAGYVIDSALEHVSRHIARQRRRLLSTFGSTVSRNRPAELLGVFSRGPALPVRARPGEPPTHQQENRLSPQVAPSLFVCEGRRHNSRGYPLKWCPDRERSISPGPAVGLPSTDRSLEPSDVT